MKGDALKTWEYDLGEEGLAGFRVEEVFVVDGIAYWPPHIAMLARMAYQPDAPRLGTGNVVRRPMIDVLADHGCPQEGCVDEWGDLYSGDFWRWKPRCPTAEALAAGSPLTARPATKA